MRKFVTLFFIFLIFFMGQKGFSQGESDWSWSHQKPQGNTLRWLKVWDPNKWFMVGFNGTFMKTSNAGQNWFVNHEGVFGSLYSAHFFDENTGVVCGLGGVMRTTDAGVTWDSAAGNFVSSVSWYSMKFANNMTGYIVGTTSGRFASTTDGGATWTQVGSTVPTLPTGTYYDLHVFDANNIIVVSSQASSANVRKTTDGGLTWTAHSAGTGTNYAVNFVDNNTGFIAASGGNHYKSTDGGVTWNPMTVGAPNATFQHIYIRETAPTSPHTLIMLNDTLYGTATQIAQKKASNDSLMKYVMTNLSNYDVMYRDTLQSAVPTFRNYRTIYLVETDNIPSTVLKATMRDSLKAFINSGTAGSKKSFIVFGGDFGYNYSRSGATQRDTVLCADLMKWRYIVDNATIAANRKITGVLINNELSDSLNPAANFFPDGVFPIAPSSALYRYNFRGPADTVAGVGYVGTTYNTAIICSDPRYITPLAGDPNSGLGRIFTGVKNYIQSNGGSFGVSGNVTQGGNPEIYITGDAFNIYKSTDLGTTWTPMPFLGPIAQQPWTGAYYHTESSGNTFVTVGSTGLINSSTNNGANWTAHTYWIKAGTLNDVYAANNNEVWAVGATGNTTVNDQFMFTTNGGTNWTVKLLPVNNNMNGISMVNSTTGYLCGITGTVYKTTNNGDNWTDASPSATVAFNEIQFINVNTGWVFGATGNVWKTTDGGTSWTQQTSGVTVTINDAYMVDANTGWFGGTSANLRKTTDGGATWESQNANVTTGPVNSIKMVNANTGYLVSTTGRVRKTTDGGANWNEVVSPVTSTLNDVDATDENNVMVVGLSGVAMKSSDGGTTWMLETTGGGTLNAISMASNDTAYAVGLSASIFKYAAFMTGTTTFTNNVPMTYELQQNYPNPFNPVTNIKFALPKAGAVSLKIYDITGRQVATLYNRMEFNAGTFNVQFNGSNLSSGAYFYSLEVDGKIIDTKRMMMIK